MFSLVGSQTMVTPVEEMPNKVKMLAKSSSSVGATGTLTTGGGEVTPVEGALGTVPVRAAEGLLTAMVKKVATMRKNYNARGICR